ncbi:MAG: LuxR C-terminal-related transcriptional regulator [Actinomycetota bacterium]|nr:LuxR C-terminal-related transcriptional regulator [Actinomycetota bacterium]
MTAQRHSRLAATKLQPPLPPVQLVRRGRLEAQLDESLARQARLILASAPAGSGKSTLLSSWLAGRPEVVAWLQVEESDSDPARFWSYLTEAIAATQLAGVVDLREVVAGSGGDDLLVVPEVVNRLSQLTEPLIVVVDDYHLIESASVHRGVERLVELCPPQVVLVISTRIDPPFRLGRLRVRNQLAEVRAADLRFDHSEAPGLLGAAGQALDRAQLDRLCARTEGWAAGLVLAGLSMGRSDDPGEFIDMFGGDDQLVVDYLGDELIAGVEAADLRRLLETSILDQLEGGLIDAVTGDVDGASWLRETASGNQLIIGLDRTGDWFRYHHLLRDLLRSEARRSFPDRLAELHRRAAAWFDERGDHRQAILHLLAAGEPQAAAALMRFHGTELLRAGQIETLRALLDQLGDAVRTSTACALLLGWCEFIGGRYTLARSWLDIGLDVAPDGFDSTLAMPLHINISLATGDVASALDVARVMVATDQLATHAADLSTATGAAFAWAGRQVEARAALGSAVEMAPGQLNRTAHVLALVYSAVVEFDAIGGPVAHAAAETALATADRFGLAAYHGVAPAYAVRARTDSDPTRSRADVARALELVRRASTDLARGFVLTVCGDTLLGLGDASGGALLDQARVVLARCPDPGIVGSHLTRAEARHGTSARPEQAVGMVEQLTDREVAVLRFLPTQLTQRDIAHELFVSLNTIKTHCSAIYRKLGVGDRKAAVQAARDHALL